MDGTEVSRIREEFPCVNSNNILIFQRPQGDFFVFLNNISHPPERAESPEAAFDDTDSAPPTRGSARQENQDSGAQPVVQGWKARLNELLNTPG